MSVRQKVSRRSVLTEKCPHGEVYVRRSVRTAKGPTAKYPMAKFPTVKNPVTDFLYLGQRRSRLQRAFTLNVRVSGTMLFEVQRERRRIHYKPCY